MAGTADWLPLSEFALEAGLTKPQAKQAAAQRAPLPHQAGSSGADALIAIALLAGIAIAIYALTSMETSVISMAGDDTFNLSRAHNQSNILAIGLTMAGSAMISLAARAGRKL
ncbi:MAG: hypothetical protein EOP86_19290 [Verrucomicrobiaceae bacterium]|nr:MAG: hypothetical protein EOP86_19290 [Verrucomicrobiaceae bacterium]